ncbi:MAG: thiamine pyrophosphate-binding protein [Bacteroidota bacterium]
MKNKPLRWNRDYVFDVLQDLGIRYIFGVPGTNEIPIIDGTSYKHNDVEYIECLHENIAMGAAMGSARMTGRPGVVVVHVTPGIAHGIGNLFNASRSQMPLVIICAQQQNELVTQEPLLASNLVEMAQQFCKWAHEIRTPEEVPLVLQRAFKEAMAPPNGPVFISVPWEYMMREIGPDDKLEGVTRISPDFTGDPAAIKQAAKTLAAAKNPIIVGGDAIGYEDAWPEMQELAETLGAPVVLQTFSSVANFPNNDYHWQGELPGGQQEVRDVFANHDVAFMVGYHAQAQIAVFKYSDGPLIPKSVKQVYLTNNTWDLGKNYYGSTAILGGIKATLPKLNALLKKKPPKGAKARNAQLKKLDRQRTRDWNVYLKKAKAAKEIWAAVIADSLRKVILEKKLESDFVYVHEAVSDGAPFQYFLPFGTQGAKPISYYCVAGGSLGWSMPASLGIKLEPKGHQGISTKLVINAVGDGSSLFYPQVWWTATHEKLPILYIITNNHEYHTLQLGLQQVIGAYGDAPGYRWNPKTTDPPYLRLERPRLDFVSIAKAFGVKNGQVVKSPKAVLRAVRKGIDHVLRNKSSFILDMRIAQNTPTVKAATEKDRADYLKRYTEQPPLNFFHQPPQLLKARSAGKPGEHQHKLPVIF